MVASHQSSSRSSIDRNGPHLRLVIDNTAGGADEAARHIAGFSSPWGEPGPASAPAALPVEVGAWLKAVAGLVLARWRLARQHWRINYGNFGLTERVGEHVVIGALAALVLLGGLVGLRSLQESSGGVVAAVGDGVSASTDSAVVNVAAVSEGSSQVAAGSVQTVVVHPGDSLWSIAVTRFPEQDPRRVVDAFVDANGGSMISVGQQLIVPDVLLED